MSSCMLEEEKTRVRAKYKEFLRQRNIQGKINLFNIITRSLQQSCSYGWKLLTFQLWLEMRF